MKTKIIGRIKEMEVLNEALVSDESEMISIIGRRRVGKTFLIRHVYGQHIDFEMSGIQHASGEKQLRNFYRQLRRFLPETKLENAPKDWLDAFFALVDALEAKQKKEKLVVFFDEVPWMATHKSDFLQGLSYFWNSWAVRKYVVVVVCGSAASWMINKILRNKGGLYNRVTRRIRLKPFNLAETKIYLNSRSIFPDHHHLIQLYMVMGGIPHYLKEIKTGLSATQNINRICFEEDGLLKEEFMNLYPALFEHANYHELIIRALAKKQSGLTRNEIIKTTKIPAGGRLTQVLIELSESGFITSYPAFGKRKKEKLFRLTDEYSLFYLRFIEKNHLDEGAWMSLSQTQSYKIWCGYAFENVCLKHIKQIKKALGLSGIYTSTSSFYKKGTVEEAGTQIDLLIDRNDRIINLVEIKFYNTDFTITKAYARKLREKMRIFKESTKTNKQIFITIITTFGLNKNMHSLSIINSDLTMDSLFEM